MSSTHMSPGKRKGRTTVRYVHELQKGESRRGPRMDSLDWTLGVPRSCTRVSNCQGIREALCVGGEVAGLLQAHMGSHDGVGVLGDDVEKFREVGDQHIHNPALKPGKVHLHAHRADHLL